MATLPPVRRGTGRGHDRVRPTPSSSPVHTSSQARSVRFHTPEKLLQQYIVWHEAEGHSRKTETDYQKSLRPFFAYLKSEHQLEDLGALELEHLRSWLVWLRNTPS